MVKFDVIVRGRLAETACTAAVPRGHCQAEAGEGDVRLSWRTETGGLDSVTIPAHRFEEHLQAGAIVIVDAAQLREPHDLPAA